MRTPHLARMLALTLCCVQLAACARLGYYGQAVRGHLLIASSARPVEVVIDDPSTADALRQRLLRSQRMRSFASEVLDLPDNGSYRSYVELDRRYVLWNVFAAPALSLEPRRWCHPFVGCLSYRGYYSQAAAQAFAAQLAARGDDVYVAPVAAYSTLGWLDDPLLSSMFRWDDARLARVLFHELAHQKFYLSDDTDLNEAFATAVADIAVERWFDAENDDGGAAEARARGRRDADFVALVLRTRDRLGQAYAESAGRSDRLRRKQALLGEMRAEYEQWKLRWDGYTGYDQWMSRSLNNAKLASVATYHLLVPRLLCLARGSGDQLQGLYSVMEALAAQSPEQRRRCLSGGADCPLAIRAAAGRCNPISEATQGTPESL